MSESTRGHIENDQEGSGDVMKKIKIEGLKSRLIRTERDGA